jgi:membrane-associated protease RseP (regulator of RpoE activity)
MSDETQEQPAAEGGEGAAPAAEPQRGTIHVPMWVALVVAGVVLVGAGFGIGWAAAPGGGGDHGEARIGRPIPFNPGGPAQFPNPGNGGFPGVGSAAFLGVTTQPAPSGQQGAQVGTVQTGSPADQAGLKAGDVITAVDGNAVASPQELRQRIVSHQPGDQVTITYTRAGASAQATVKLGTRGANS